MLQDGAHLTPGGRTPQVSSFALWSSFPRPYSNPWPGGAVGGQPPPEIQDTVEVASSADWDMHKQRCVPPATPDQLPFGCGGRASSSSRMQDEGASCRSITALHPMPSWTRGRRLAGRQAGREAKNLLPERAGDSTTVDGTLSHHPPHFQQIACPPPNRLCLGCASRSVHCEGSQKRAGGSSCSLRRRPSSEWRGGNEARGRAWAGLGLGAEEERF